MSQYNESAVDRAIREAQERGEFDDLPGAGKPLNLGAGHDADWWIKGLIQREQLDMSAALPPGIALRREVERLPQTLADIPTEAMAREVVEDLNDRILADRRRLTTGPTVVARTVDVDEVMAQWRAVRAARYTGPGDDSGADISASGATASPRRGGWLGRLLRRG